MSFVIDFGERQRRIAEGIESLKEQDKASAEQVHPEVKAIETPTSSAFELLCDFAVRCIEERKNPYKFRQAAIRIACGINMDGNTSFLAASGGRTHFPG